VGIEIGEAQAERVKRKTREERRQEDFMRGFYQSYVRHCEEPISGDVAISTFTRRHLHLAHTCPGCRCRGVQVRAGFEMRKHILVARTSSACLGLHSTFRSARGKYLL
jgi:hypothetical protein